MSYDFHERKQPLMMSYADLFKSSSSNQSLSSRDTSSLSGISSPFGSELASSSESDDGEFAFELSRQMAEVMLQEDDGDQNEEELQVKNSFANEAASGHHVKNNIYNEKSNLNYGHEMPPPVLEVYQLRNQPPHVGEAHVNRKELSYQKTEHHHRHRYCINNRQQQKSCYKGSNNAAHQYGSGMRAIFLGGIGSGSSGTGVFLPRSAYDPTSMKRKSGTGGCSTVLIPTRVLQALELHFNRLQESKASPSPNSGSPQSLKDESTEIHNYENLRLKDHQYANNDNEDMQLPQEWTY